MTLSILSNLREALTHEEMAALSHYGADSTFLHAHFQGRLGDFQYHPNCADFIGNCRSIIDALDGALAKSSLSVPAQLYSGHGNGIGIRGSLTGTPASFIGLTYRYPGFISTTTDVGVANNFLEKKDLRPTFLKLNLPAGFSAVDMKHGNHFGECEFLLGRNIRFTIVDAAEDKEVLWLVLQP